MVMGKRPQAGPGRVRGDSEVKPGEGRGDPRSGKYRAPDREGGIYEDRSPVARPPYCSGVGTAVGSISCSRTSKVLFDGVPTA